MLKLNESIEKQRIDFKKKKIKKEFILNVYRSPYIYIFKSSMCVYTLHVLWTQFFTLILRRKQ